jgi:putative selenate reductase FAD-binding subunit
MITAYHRPQNLDEALKLISRSSPETVPLGGGTILSQHRGDSIEVVDLQALGLNHIAKRGKHLDVGAAVSLQALLESPECPEDMALALKLEAPLSLRNSATVAVPRGFARAGPLVALTRSSVMSPASNNMVSASSCH